MSNIDSPAHYNLVLLTAEEANFVLFTQFCCVQVDWADPDIEGYVTELMNNRNVCVRNLPRTVQDFQIRDFFNSLSSGQVENIVRTAGYVLVTFLSPGKTMISYCDLLQ